MNKIAKKTPFNIRVKGADIVAGIFTSMSKNAAKAGPKTANYMARRLQSKIGQRARKLKLYSSPRHNTQTHLSETPNKYIHYSGQRNKYRIFMEKFDGLDPAVIRPGRCLAKIEFPKLPQEQANTWLRNKGTDSEVDEDVTLAELYHRLRGKKELYEASMTSKVGFDTEWRVERQEKIEDCRHSR